MLTETIKKSVINTHDFTYCTFPQAIARDLEIEDDNGNKMPAMKVFSACISYLRQHMTDACNSRHVDIEDDEIQWVLTVPAIWTDGAKQFMREAAIRVLYLCVLLIYCCVFKIKIHVKVYSFIS